MSTPPPLGPPGAPATGGPARAKAIRCPRCGGSITLRALGQSVMVACPFCRSQIDVSQPEIRLIRAFQEAAANLLIPLGARATLRGQVLEVIGALRRRDVASGYEWEEYLLFNPYVGFRWLVYDEDHWNLGHTVKDTSKIVAAGNLHYAGHIYRKYAAGQAQVLWVVGEFYWRVAAGDRAETGDYVAPPLMLSREKADGEVTWTQLEYLEPKEVAQAFGIECDAPDEPGANQPNPAGRAFDSVKSVMWIALLLLIVVQIASAFMARDTAYPVGLYDFPRPAGQEDQVFGPFALASGHSVNELVATAPLNNSWVELNGSLVNVDTGKSYDFTDAFAYYYGSDSDGSWTEGSTRGSALLTEIPSGNYKLVVAGEGGSDKGGALSTSVSLAFHHDVLAWRNFWLVFLWILAYPAYLLVRSRVFEKARWANSSPA
jgi:Domain of unknown function (DUF4178)